MRDELLLYYERELNYLRQLGTEFGEKYPKIAGRLILEADKCEDPHVERLLEGFAFLAARVHLKIDDEFPEITEALLSILVSALHSADCRRCRSSKCIWTPRRAARRAPQKIPRGAMLNSRPVGGVPCQFRTCFDTTVWPLRVTAGEWTSPDRLSPPVKSLEAAAAIRIEFRARRMSLLPKLGWIHCASYLRRSEHRAHALRIDVRQYGADPGARPHARIRASGRWACVRRVSRRSGFTEDESMLPYPRRSFPGYRLLQEYFTFPDKFFFFDLTGLGEVWPRGFKNRFELVFLFSPFEQAERRQMLELGVSAKTFRINCDAHRQSVRADRRADSAGSAPLRVSGGSRRPPPAGDRSFFDRRSAEHQSAVE